MLCRHACVRVRVGALAHCEHVCWRHHAVFIVRATRHHNTLQITAVSIAPPSTSTGGPRPATGIDTRTSMQLCNYAPSCSKRMSPSDVPGVMVWQRTHTRASNIHTRWRLAYKHTTHTKNNTSTKNKMLIISSACPATARGVCNKSSSDIIIIAKSVSIHVRWMAAEAGSCGNQHSRQIDTDTLQWISNEVCVVEPQLIQ